MNKSKQGFKNLYLHILFILSIGGIGVQTLTSCSAVDETLEQSSSSVIPSSSSVVNSSSSGIPSSSSVPSSSSLPSSSSPQAIVPIYGEPITDARDGQTYEIVVIGTQTWMAKNLNFEAGGSKCYGDNSVNCTLYGRLYDWETVMNGEPSSDKAPSGVQGICPAGFHVPSDLEWGVLDRKKYRDVLNIGIVDGTIADLKATYGWQTSGYDTYGFSALPGGFGFSNGNFSRLGSLGSWWTATNDGNKALTYDIEEGNVITIGTAALRSLRCIKNYNPPPSSSSYNPVPCKSGISADGILCDDRDGNEYKVTHIGSQFWMAENLNFKVEGCSEDATIAGMSRADYLCPCSNDNCALYGRVYSWATAMAIDPTCDNSYCVSQIAEKHQGICPKNWHIPSSAEWDKLIEDVGGSSTAGQMLKAQSGWSSGNGMDAFGFSALPGGITLNGATKTDVGTWWYILYGSNSHRTVYIGTGTGVSFTTGGSNSVRCARDPLF